ncbi:hypothetical protein M3Y99_00810700 [Aphelenchoides fujianensis]|nr:hypothetical protein M3Y99_00810100 [Aphelenchoides fujianensis]KAI6234296.1 hypothetical protein M3Y99_00810700 [Aphelenchoides fujianensis]
MSSAFAGQGIVPGSGAQLVGSGYGTAQLAPPEVQQRFQGKPAFFDTDSGVFFDGQQAFVYVAPPPQAAEPAAPQANDSTATAFETPELVLGNGTAGDLEEHRNAVASAYLMNEPAAVATLQ